MDRPALGTTGHMAVDDSGCAQHVWVLAVVGEGRGRLDIASTCSLCGALNHESGPATHGEGPRVW